MQISTYICGTIWHKAVYIESVPNYILVKCANFLTLSVKALKFSHLYVLFW